MHDVKRARADQRALVRRALRERGTTAAPGSAAGIAVDAASRACARVARALGGEHFGPLSRAFASQGLALFKQLPEHHYVHRYYGNKSRKLSMPLDDPDFMAVAEPVQRARRTHLYYDRLYTLYQAVRNVCERKADGPIEALEAGTQRGGSAFFQASVLERLAPGRCRLTAVDTFTGFSALDLPEPEGRRSPERFGPKGDLFPSVEAYLGRFAFVEVVQARIQDAAPSIADRRFDLVHLDMDVYHPTAFALDFCAERLNPGGIIVVDDYGFKTCPGAERAVDEFWARQRGRFVKLDLPTGQCCVVSSPAPAPVG